MVNKLNTNTIFTSSNQQNSTNANVISKFDVHILKSKINSLKKEVNTNIYEHIINAKSNINNSIPSTLSTNEHVHTAQSTLTHVSGGADNTNSRKKVINKVSNVILFDYLNKINQFNKYLGTNKFITSPFNKSFPFEGLDTKQRGTVESLPFKIASKIIKYTFLSIGVFISKPVFSILHTNNRFDNEITSSSDHMITHRKIKIHLFYYVKVPKYRLNKLFTKYNHELIKDIDLISDYKEKVNMHSINITPKHFVQEWRSRNNILVTFNNRFEYLLQFLGKLFKSDIELECVRLNKTYFESNILVQDLAMKSYRNRFVKLTRKLFRKAHTFNPFKAYKLNEFIAYPSFLSGIHIKLAGRAFKQRIIPRMTVKYAQKGTLTNVNVKLLDKGRFTGKTRRGSYTFTVTLAHIFK